MKDIKNEDYAAKQLDALLAMLDKQPSKAVPSTPDTKADPAD
jgi:hypothetical protein